MTTDPKRLHSIYSAAAAIEVANHREAAIVGGIVASLTARDRIELKYAQHAAVAIMDMGRSLSVLDGMDTSGRLPEPNRPGLMPCVAMLFAVRRFSRGGFPCAQVFQFQIMDMARRFMEALGGSADGVAA